MLTSGREVNLIFLGRLLCCDVTPYILVEVYPVSQEPIARTIYPDDGGIVFLRSVEKCVLRHGILSFKRRYIPLNIGLYFLTVCCWHGTSCQTAQCFKHLTLFTNLFSARSALMAHSVNNRVIRQHTAVWLDRMSGVAAF